MFEALIVKDLKKLDGLETASNKILHVITPDEQMLIDA